MGNWACWICCICCMWCIICLFMLDFMLRFVTRIPSIIASFFKSSSISLNSVWVESTIGSRRNGSMGNCCSRWFIMSSCGFKPYKTAAAFTCACALAFMSWLLHKSIKFPRTDCWAIVKFSNFSIFVNISLYSEHSKCNLRSANFNSVSSNAIRVWILSM